jgi:chromosome segregation ATPase
MNYDPKYRDWVEKFLEENKTQGTELLEPYRNTPVIRTKIRENPPQYRFHAPLISGRMRTLERLREKIDQRLDKTPSAREKGKVTRRVVDVKGDEGVSYFLKWQNCQLELEDMKRREAGLVSKLEELQGKMDELGKGITRESGSVRALRESLQSERRKVEEMSSTVVESRKTISELRNEVVELKNQLKASEGRIEELNTKLARLQASKK